MLVLKRAASWAGKHRPDALLDSMDALVGSAWVGSVGWKLVRAPHAGARPGRVHDRRPDLPKIIHILDTEAEAEGEAEAGR